MKFLIAALSTSFLALPSLANSYYTCQLSEIPGYSDNITISGTVTINKLAPKNFTMDVDAVLTLDDNGEKETQDMVVTGEAMNDFHMNESQVLDSEEWQVLAQEFGDEAPKGAHGFQSKGFEDDAAGLRLVVVHGKKNTKKSVVYLGWMPALCK
jgi:hypothetical protein